MLDNWQTQVLIVQQRNHGKSQNSSTYALVYFSPGVTYVAVP